MFSNKFIEEISEFKTIYCLVSGGVHSTVSALELFLNGFKNIILLHNNTLLNLESAKKIIQQIKDYTNYEYIELKPKFKPGENLKIIMNDSFKKIPEVIQDIKNKKYDRTKFKCCNILKKYPTKLFFKGIDKENSVIIQSICIFESNKRFFWLYDLKKSDTFIRLHKKYGDVYFAYPWRDYHQERPFFDYLKKMKWRVFHSGCKICPILICFKKLQNIEPERYLASAKIVRNLKIGVQCNFWKSLEAYY